MFTLILYLIADAREDRAALREAMSGLQGGWHCREVDGMRARRREVGRGYGYGGGHHKL